MNVDQYLKSIFEKELQHLEDNIYRYKLDNKNGKHDKIISEIQEKINLLKNKQKYQN